MRRRILFRLACLLIYYTEALSFFRGTTISRRENARLFGAITNSEAGGSMLVNTVADGSIFADFYSSTMKNLVACEELTPIPLDDEFRCSRGKLGKSLINFRSEAFSSSLLRYVRMVSFVGEGYDVFNFLAIPRSNVAIPILGVDVVCLPGGSLAAIDFQPTSSDRTIFEGSSYKCIAGHYSKWTDVFPSGGELPEDAKRYFSPYALWTRIPPPPPPSSDDPISTRDTTTGTRVSSPLMKLVGEALDDYVRCYADLLSAAAIGIDISTSTASRRQQRRVDGDHDHEKKDEDERERKQFLTEYLDYRIQKDPAKRLLQSSFGVDWTHRVITEVLFPKV